MGQTTCRVVVEGRTVEEILSFDYSSDVMAIAEEAHFSVENKTTSTVTSYGWASGSSSFFKTSTSTAERRR